jgi:small subunit ribosomal protein S15
MARMHSRKRGNAGSTRPARTEQPSWIRYKAKEAELLVAKIAKDGKNAAQIGVVLRDVYGIPSIKQVAKKSVTAILKERKIAPPMPDDLTALLKRNVKLNKHLESKKQDNFARRGLQLTDSKIRRIVKHYKRTGTLAQDWSFDPAKIRLLLE